MWRALVERDRGRKREGERGRDRQRMRKWQEGEKQLGRPTANSSPGTWQSSQTPWLCVCVCVRVRACVRACASVFLHLCIMTAEWKSICFYICHLECWGAQMGLPCHTEPAGSRPTQVFPPLLPSLFQSHPLLLLPPSSSFPLSSPLLSSPPVFSSLIRCQALKRSFFFFFFFFLRWRLQVTLTADVWGLFEAAIWALITLIDGSEGPCCSPEWQIKAFLDNVGNWLNRL